MLLLLVALAALARLSKPKKRLTKGVFAVVSHVRTFRTDGKPKPRSYKSEMPVRVFAFDDCGPLALTDRGGNRTVAPIRFSPRCPPRKQELVNYS